MRIFDHGQIEIFQGLVLLPHRRFQHAAIDMGAGAIESD